jgi:broad specificity phosphatase PhoE
MHTRLILIRHAASEHSVRRIIAGRHACTGLTDQGVKQAHALANRLRATEELSDCAVLLSSPVSRARRTAEIVAEALPVDTIEEDHALCEIDPGDAEGLSWEEYRARFGEFDLLASPNRPFAPEGESWSTFIDRVGATQRRVTEQFAGGTIVAVTHAGFVVASILRTFDIPRPGTGAWLEPIHTSLTAWSVSDTTWMLTRYNDAGHLPRRE